MLEKKEEEFIQILPDGQMQIRKDTAICEDGKEIARTHHRRVVSPDTDVTNETDRVKTVSQAVHTKEVKDKWEAKKEKDLL